jgi:hypothetical protein
VSFKPFAPDPSKIVKKDKKRNLQFAHFFVVREIGFLRLKQKFIYSHILHHPQIPSGGGCTPMVLLSGLKATAATVES